MHCAVITTAYTLLCIGYKAMVVGSQEGKYRSHLELYAPAMGELLFTDSALWAGSVIESPCLFVCLFVCLSVPSGAVFLERSSSHHNFHTVRARDLKF